MILGEDQLNALTSLKYFLNSSNPAISLIGYAGTGKTTVIKYFLEFLDSIKKPYVLCAPTHKAKIVLENATDREGMTLHKLLSLSPNVEIFDLDLRDLKFLMGFVSLYPQNGVIICDEASMVNDDLYDLILKNAKTFNTKILFVGDNKQLKPVNAKMYSKVFDIENSIQLNTIYRQKELSGLNYVLPELRQNVIKTFDTIEGVEGSVYTYSDIKDFFSNIMTSYKEATRESNILHTKVLAYTNQRVNALSDKIRNTLFENDLPYNKFEFITSNENFEFGEGKFWNSMDYIITNDIQKKTINIPEFMSLPGYQLNLYDSSNKAIYDILILDKDISPQYFNTLSGLIEAIRKDAIIAKQRKDKKSSGKLWARYYSMINSFSSPIDLYYEGRLIKKKTFSSGYASTIHKSQGSSINNVFIDMKNVLICKDQEELRQLQYVGASRTVKDLHIYQ